MPSPRALPNKSDQQHRLSGHVLAGVGQRFARTIFSHDPAEETLLPATKTEQPGHGVDLGDPAAGPQRCQAEVVNGLGVGGEGDADPLDLGVSGEDGEFSTSTDLEGRLGCLKTLWLVFGGWGLRVTPGESQAVGCSRDPTSSHEGSGLPGEAGVFKKAGSASWCVAVPPTPSHLPGIPASLPPPLTQTPGSPSGEALGTPWMA